MATYLLVIGFKSGGYPIVDHPPYVGLVNPHPKRNSCNHNVQVIRKESCVDAPLVVCSTVVHPNFTFEASILQ